MLSRSFRAFPFLLALAACGGHGQSASGSGSSGRVQTRPPEVIVDTVRVTNAPNIFELPGRVQAVRTAEVRARVTGIVERRLYTEGSDVRAGQVLYQIDPLPLRATLDAAVGALRRAQANALNARQDVDRFKPLVAENAISRQEYDAATSKLAVSDADVRSARAQVDQAKLNLGYASVTAPIAGRAGRTQVTEGALASSTAATLLTTIDQLDPIYVNVSQSNAELLALRHAIDKGELRVGKFNDTRVRLIQEDGTPYEYPGKLDFLDLTVDPTTGGVSLRAQFPNPRRRLLPGEYVRARVEAGVDQAAMTVPQSAVTIKPEGASVMLVDAANRAVSQPVVLGQLAGDRWIVQSGLKAGDRIIVLGLQKAKAGAVVAPVMAGAAAAVAGR